MVSKDHETQRTDTFISYSSDDEARELHLRVEKRFIPKTLAVGFGSVILGAFIGVITSEGINLVAKTNLSHEDSSFPIGVICGVYGMANYVKKQQGIQETQQQDTAVPV